MKAQIQIDGNPYQITIQKVLTFDQLDEDAKAKAHENLMGTAHSDWWDNVYSMIADTPKFVLPVSGNVAGRVRATGIGGLRQGSD